MVAGSVGRGDKRRVEVTGAGPAERSAPYLSADLGHPRHPPAHVARVPAPLPLASATDPATAALAAVADVARRLAGPDPLDAVLPGIVEAIRDATGAERCALWLADDAGLRLAAGLGADGDAAQVRRVLGELEAARREARPPRLHAEQPHVAPLVHAAEAVGALVLRVPDPGPHAWLFAETAASLLAPALAQAERLRRLQDEVVRSTRQIEEERRFVDCVVDSLPTGLYVIDRDYRIRLWNRRREIGLQGVARDAAIGRTIFEILHRQPTEMLRREFEDVFQSGRVQHFSMESSSTGDLRFHRVTKIPMRFAAGGAVTHVITVVEDVTDWREAQERFAQAEKLAALGQLAAGVMHEINNPLATIAACAEALALDLATPGAAPADAPDNEYLRIIDHEVQRSKRIVDRLLEFSRPKPLAPEPVDLNGVVEETLFLLKHHSRFKKFTVRADLATPAPVARGNAEQLVQVLMALLVNAMDATGESGTIELRTVGGGDAPEATIEVRDHGHGIPRSQMGKIFEPFFTTKAPGRGTGLGLSICYGIVAEHGGRITVESEPDAGTTFRIVLPALRDAGAAS